ncbi:MAG: ABC transporter permease subunit [Terriglobia bacterium]|nr:ABC transporter permease subunit [Terriglobia bacterium]
MSTSSISQRFYGLPWRLWFRQVRSVVALESRRNLFTWRSFWVYFLAFGPTAIIMLHALVDKHSRMDEDTQVLAAIFQFYYLRLAMFFGCLGIFTRLIRGEMVERSLHYYLLSPVRREVMLIGKFVAGAIRSILLFGSAVLLSFFFIYLPHGAAGEAFISEGPGKTYIYAYLGITVLACLAYGAIFLLFSMLMKNPTPAALLLMGWEFISSILPAFLQKFSVTYYLRPMLPVTIPGEGLFALLTVNVEPVPAWISTAGVLSLTAAVLALCCWRVRTLEISYTAE